MGEARRRRDASEAAYAAGRPVPRPVICPGCSSRAISIEATPMHLRAAPFGLPAEIGVCRSCRAVWEPFAATYVEDPVAAEPCDNCAFRPGSPEQADKAAWRALLDSLRPDADGMFTGRFYCHKNVPIDMTKGPGNHLHPTTPDGTLDQRRMRTCSGFLRMVWALNGAIRREEAHDA
jgi:hypothetical protein